MYDEKLVLDNVNLIYLVIKKLGLYHKQEEYFDLGMIGLVKGAKNFNKDKGYAPSTYLYRCIYNEISHYLYKKELKMVSIDSNINDEQTFEDIIPDKKTVESDFFANLDSIIIKEAINKLPEREQLIINMTFELNGYKKTTQKTMSEVLNISQSYIPKLKTKALNQLRIELERTLYGKEVRDNKERNR
jgi:RNA polymerase sigma factor (sigma-70 family)